MLSGQPAANEAAETMAAQGTRRMNIVIGGHVDHGKSTVIGRLLADTKSLPLGKVEAVRAQCERTARPFEYAFLLDALKDEQAQGITIDAARIFFRTALRQYMVLDAPGHVEFLKNMVTGASRAEAALLVIDAREGIQENSRRHGYLMSMLGIRQIAVLVNKMDLVGFDVAVFDRITTEYRSFLSRLDIAPSCFIPVAARDGQNLVSRSEAMPWFVGSTVVEALDDFHSEPPATSQPFRMPVQEVYKFTARGDDRRIVAGTIASGQLSVGDEVVFYPSGKKSRVQSIEAFNRPIRQTVSASMATGFTLQEQVYVARGELAARPGQLAPRIATRLRVSLFWLGKRPLVRNRDYLLKIGTARVAARLTDVQAVVDAASLVVTQGKDQVDRHEVAECTLAVSRAVAVDLAEDLAATSRFVIVDDYEIRGGGIVRETLPDAQSDIREKVILRNMKWEPSSLRPEQRAEKYGQRATLVLVTGVREGDRKTFAKDLEVRLFADGRIVYYLGMANVVYGVDADIARAADGRAEHVRRLGEVANMMLDAGAILIVTAHELAQDDLEVIKTVVDPSRIEVVWVGDEVTTDVRCDMVLGGQGANVDEVARMKQYLQDKGTVFRPW